MQLIFLIFWSITIYLFIYFDTYTGTIYLFTNIEICNLFFVQVYLIIVQYDAIIYIKYTISK